MTMVRWRVWTLLGAALAAGCGGGGDERAEKAPVADAPPVPVPSMPPSAHAGQVLAGLRNALRVPSPILPLHTGGGPQLAKNIVQLLPAGADGTFFRGAGQIIPRFGGSASGAGPASAPPASMALPAQANGAFDLRDVASGLAVTVSLRGTTDASVEVSDGYLVYPAAYEGGADLVNRPYPSGTEQSLAFAAKPDAEQITYDVALGPGVQGVRLVANTVEFLDGQGAPRLRMAPPFIAGSQSTSAWPSVGVQGCAVDTSPAPPWNRPVVVPGGTHCIVTVDWSQSSLQYPALLDPTWSVGSTMAVARMHHGGARVTASGKELALVFGGYAFTSTVASAELFDEATGTWAQTGNLVTDVSYAPAVALANGTALAVGGFRVTAAGGVETDSVQVYSPTTGTWSLQGHLGSAREEHTATLLGSGNVLVAGGFGAYPQVFASALLYNPSTGAATGAGSMQSARGDHSATRLGNGKVLVVDGMGPNATPASAADLYDPTANTWSVVPAPPVPARFSHVAPLLASGKVLMVGGEDLSTSIAQTLSTAIYDPTANTWTVGPSTLSSHFLGTAVVLAQGTNVGKVLLAGGDFALNGVELFDPTALSWAPIAPLLTGRDAHVAIALTSGILLAGGSDSNGTLLSSAELYQPDVGATAPQWPANKALTVTPLTGTSVLLSWPAANDPNGVASYAIYENGQLLTTVSGSSLSYTVTGLSTGANVTFGVQAVDASGAPTGNGPTAKLTTPPTAISPSPIDRSVSTDIAAATSFLYSGPDPIQAGVAAGTIVPATAAVIRGHVYTPAGTGLAGVVVTMVGHPEFGNTFTQSDGGYDFAVNGGQTLRLHFGYSGYLPVERTVQVPWRDYVTATDVVFTQLDSQVTVVDVSSSAMGLQVARGSLVSDTAGNRTATVFVSPGTQATMTLPDGTTAPLNTMSVRATEYSVGTSGPSAMPALLPAASAYGYAVELSADEAISAGASRVTFSEPLSFYVENFLGLPVGASLPSGSYHASQGAWVPEANGLVLQILSIAGGTASLDINGDGVADTGSALAAIGITGLEQQELAALYTAGETLWRVPVAHFTGYALGPDEGPPPGAADDACDQITCTDGNGNDIPCQVGEDVIPCLDQNNKILTPGCTSDPHYCETHGLGAGTTGGICAQVSPIYNLYCCPQHYGNLGCPLEVCSAGGSGTTCRSAPPPPPPDGNGPGNCRDPHASTIECQRQSLGEDLALAGTPLALHYESDRQRGRQATLTIPLSDASFPSAATGGISMQVSVAGRLFNQSFGAGPYQSTTFTWDGKDAYGRLLQGSQRVNVQLGNVYAGAYQNSSAFGVVGSGAQLGTGTTRQPFVLSQGWTGTIQAWDSQPQGLGGWTLNVHHAYDVSGRTLRLGDGTNRTLTDLPPVIQTVAGNGQPSNSGDGSTATSAAIAAPQAVAIGPDGSIYIASAQSCIRRIGPDGVITTYAGQCNSAGFSGDEGAATSAKLQSPQDIAIGPDGSVFVADTGNQRIRRVDQHGFIHTVAGSGVAGFSGDRGPAIDATFQSPSGIDVAPDGTLYIADSLNYCVRSVSPDGVIRTVAGNNSSSPANPNGNQQPATSTSLALPVKVRVGRDGSVYIAETAGNVVRRVGPDGIIRAFAGLGTPGFGGDGGPATAATLTSPADVAIGGDGTVYILDGNQTLRAVSSRGTISTVAGVAGSTAFAGDNGPAAAATMGNSQGVRVAPDGSLYIANTADNRVRRVQPALPGFSASASTIRLPSEDGRQIYVFDTSGRHQQTLDAFTSTALYRFSYDSGGRLSAIADSDGNLTQISHDSNENLTSIVGPFGARTAFTSDTNGYLATATDPDSEETRFTYDANGLLLTKTDPRGDGSQYSYDSLGRLQRDQDPAGGFKALTRTESTTGFAVNSSTSLVHTTYQTTMTASGSFSRQNTLPSGLQSSLQFTPNSVTTVTVPDGTITTTNELPDPRLGFGMLAPMRSVVAKTPAGLTSTSTTTRADTLSGPNLATFTEQTSLNGNTWTRLFNASSRTWTTTSPMGRTTTTTVDAAGRTTQVVIPNVTPFAFAYDAHGRLVTTTQGTHTWTQGYDAQGYLASVTDPLSHALSYTNDPVGRPTQTQLPDGRFLGTTYDGNSDTTGVTLPSPESHLFSYTPVDLVASYTPPSVGTGSFATQYVYDLDRKLNTVTRPDGVTINYGYDSAGRLQTTAYPQGTLAFAYNGSTGQLASRSPPNNEVLQYTYDGFLMNGVTWSGPVAGTLSLGFDNNFRMTSQTVNGTALAFGYDLDGLLTGAGALTLTLDTQNGRLNGTTLGSMTDSYAYDANGLFASYTAKYNGNALYTETVLRDAVGRITQKTETVQGTTHVWAYTFDVAGRLTDVTEDGNFFSHYGYDADDNRTTYQKTGGTLNPTYDAQDRLVTYGSATYGYTANGELTSKTVAGQATSYAYDVLGNLLHFAPPTGSAIDYVVDGENRRVGKKLGGTLTTGYLYQDALNVVAQLDGSGNLVARYVFGSKPNVPDYFTNSSGTFRIVSDHLGSPRLVVNTSSGAVVEEIDYDEFGVVTKDTSPGLTPFGFAGGLYDKDTGLVRFGARDYDASVGRWTSKDPIQFDGGMNLYRYAHNDPVNLRDLLGLDDFGTNDCSYYDTRCAQNGGSYYCSTAPYWCNRFPQGPNGDWTSDWASCTRGCLQDCDNTAHSPQNFSPNYNNDLGLCQGTGETPDNSTPLNPLSSASNFACHAACYSECAAFATGSMGALY